MSAPTPLPATSLTTSAHANRDSFTPNSPHVDSSNSRASCYRRANSSGFLANLFCPNPGQNAFVFPPRLVTPIRVERHKDSEPILSFHRRSHPTSSMSESNTMPVAQYPCTMDSYQQPAYVTYPSYLAPTSGESSLCTIYLLFLNPTF